MTNTIEEFQKSKDWGARFLGSHLLQMDVKADCVCSRCLEGVSHLGWPLAGLIMILCPQCGNKRCPKAANHQFKCTASNEPGQVGELKTAATQSESKGETK